MTEDPIKHGLAVSGKYKLLYSAEEAAEILDGCHVDFIRKNVRYFKHPAHTKKKSYPLWCIFEFIDEHTIDPRSENNF